MSTHIFLGFVAGVVIFVSWALGGLPLRPLSSVVLAANPAPEKKPAARARLTATYGQLPLAFEANQGQTATPVRFLARGSGYNLYLTPQETVLALRATKADNENRPETVLRLRLANANPAPEIAGGELLPSRSHYFLGRSPQQWRSNVAQYGKVHYRSVYPGIEVVYYGRQRQLEYDFLVAPEASPERIGWTITGAERLTIAENGDLVLHAAGQTVRQLKPFAYQEIDGQQEEISCNYVVRGNQVGLKIGAYNRQLPLVIDPALSYATFLGGTSQDLGLGLAVDGAGNAYFTGSTASPNFPAPGAIQPGGLAGVTDAFVLKLAPNGNSLLYSAYLGGSGSDSANGIALDNAGNAYLTGFTASPNFPLANALQNNLAGPSDAFVAKLNASGSALLYSTYLGGAGNDSAAGVAVDSAGQAYLTGRTASLDFPAANALQPSKQGRAIAYSVNAGDSWAARQDGLTASSVTAFAINPTTTTTAFAATETFIFRSLNAGASWQNVSQGQINARVSRLALDPNSPNTIYAPTSGNGIYKSADGGTTWATANTGLTTFNILSVAVHPNTANTVYAGTSLRGVFRSTDGGAIWSPLNTGIPSNTSISALTIDQTNPNTIYASAGFNIYKTTNGGANWAVSSNGIGGFTFDFAIDRAQPNNVYAATSTSIYKSTNGGANWAASNNGIGFGQVNTLAIDPNNTATLYLGSALLGVYKSVDGGANWSARNNGILSPTIGALALAPDNSNALYAGSDAGNDAFVTKFNANGTALLYSTYLGGNTNDIGNGLTVDALGQVYVAGQTTSPDFPTANPLQGACVNCANGDAFVSKLSSNGSVLVYSTYLGGSAADSAQAVALDNAANIYLTGFTTSTNFPTANAFQNTCGGCDVGQRDAFVTKLNANGATLAYSTYLGGASSETGYTLAVNGGGQCFVAGGSNSVNFPQRDSLRPNGAVGEDVFVTKFAADGATVRYSTLLGGNNTDSARGLALDADGNAYLTGFTSSLDFPTANALQPIYGNATDAFAVKLASAAELSVTVTTAPNPALYGEPLAYQITVANNGELAAANVVLANDIPSGAAPLTATASQGSCSGARQTRCNLGTLNSGATATATITMLPPLARTFSNTVSVSSSTPESNAANNTFTTSAQILYADLSVRLTLAQRNVAAGGTNAYIITVLNNDTQTAATNVALTDLLPPEVAFAACTATNNGVCGGNGNQRTITFPTLAPNSTANAVLNVTVNGNLAAGLNVGNTASVTTQTPDINPNNNAATATFRVLAPASATPANGAIAYVSGDGIFDGTQDIYVMNPDGSGKFDLTFTSNGNDTAPQWSPDGEKIAFVKGGIFLMNADGSNRTLITPPGLTVNGVIAWSPDGTRLAFQADGQIQIINQDGSGLTRIRAGSVLAWSPDGTRLLMRGFSSNSFELIYPDGTGSQIVAGLPFNSEEFAWSPDGAKLVFAASAIGANGRVLYTCNLDASNVTRIGTVDNVGLPTWSPDGQRLAFTRFSGPGLISVIATIKLDGTEFSVLNSTPARQNFAPTWQRRPPGAQPLTPTYNISGHLNGGTGLVGLTGTVSRSASTYITSDFVFDGLPAGGTYTLTPITTFPNTHTFTPSNRTYANLNANQTDADFTGTVNPISVSGRIADTAGNPLANVTLFTQTLFPAQTLQTGPDGRYAVNNLFPGVSFNLVVDSRFGPGPNFVFEPPVYFFDRITQSRTADFVARPKTASISGRMTVGGVPRGGISVNASLPNFAGGGSATSDNDGNYTITGLGDSGTFTVTPNTNVYPFTPVSQVVPNVTGNRPNINFDAPADQYTIRGQINNGQGTGFPNVTVRLSGAVTATTVTNNSGDFTFGPVPAAGPYTITPENSVLSFTPASMNVANLTGNTTVGFFIGYGSQISLSNVTNIVTSEAGRSVVLTVSKFTGNPAPVGTASVDYATNDGTAQQRTDYTITSGTLNFGATESTKTITIPLSDDSYLEGDETFTLTLSNPRGASLFGNPTVTIILTDDDTAAPSINQIDQPEFFVRQHYYDFLNRVPDTAGLSYWTDQLLDCGTDQVCLNRRRIGVSAAYFIELEFQDTGYFVYRFYKASYGQRPTYAQFMPDRAGLVGGAQLEQSKLAFAAAWVQRTEFLQRYPVTLTGAQYVDALIQTVQQGSDINLSARRAELIAEYDSQPNPVQSRTHVLRRLIEYTEFANAEYNPAFVLMQYFGYLRRDPDVAGYNFWLSVLNQQPANARGMVCAFITSGEFQQRFSTVVTRGNDLCGGNP